LHPSRLAFLREMSLRLIIATFSVVLPWPLRRLVLQRFLGYRMHPTSRIGFSLVACDHLLMEENSRIGHLNVFKGLRLVHLSSDSSIGSLNWITGYPAGCTRHFSSEADRRPELYLGCHAAVTNRHLLDCTARVSIGAFATFAGFRSQILTHSIDLKHSRQASSPVSIGEYSFVGSDCVILGGSVLPSRSVLGAKSLLNKSFSESYWLYGGVPARPLKELPAEWAYFVRARGFVD
jgi:hypothetical protein